MKMVLHNTIISEMDKMKIKFLPHFFCNPLQKFIFNEYFYCNPDGLRALFLLLQLYLHFILYFLFNIIIDLHASFVGRNNVAHFHDC